MANLSAGTMKAKAIQLYDVQVCSGSRLTHVMFRGLQYGVAVMKKKVLIASGTMKRNVWIVKTGSEGSTIKRK